MYKLTKYVLALTMLIQVESVTAQTMWINPLPGDWNDAVNWSSGIPTAADETTIDNGGTAQLSAANGSTAGLHVGGALLSSVIIDSGATLTTGVSANIASNFTGPLGEVTVTGAGTNWQVTNFFTVGAFAGRVGRASILDGAQVQDAAQTLVGTFGGTGEFLISDPGSSFTTPGPAFVGGGAGSQGVLDILNGGNFSSSFLSIGPAGIGEMTVSDVGSTLTTAGLLIGSDAGGQGEFNLLNGATAVAGNSTIGQSLGTGVANVSGVGTTWSAVTLEIGAGTGNGTLNIDSGAEVLVDGPVNLAVTDAGGMALLNLNGTAAARGLLSANNIAGGLGAAQINFDGGILQARVDNPSFISGFDPGQLNIASGGLFLDSQAFDIGTTNDFTGLGTLTKLGSGIFTYGGASTNSGGVVVDEGQITLDGSVSGPAVANNTSTLLVNATGTIGGPVELNDTSNALIDGTLSGAVTLNDASIMRLNAAGTITNTAVVNNTANLIANGLVTGLVTTNNQGVLSGTGTVGALDSSGILAPGDAGIGTLTVTGNHINRASGTHQNELNAAGQTDLLAVGGTSTIQGGTLELIAAPGNYLVGTTYTLITAAGGLTGEFQTVIENIDLPYILRYFPNSLVLELGGFNLNGLSGNPRRVAEFINTFSVIEGDFLTVFDALNTLNFSQLSSALDQMHPAPFQALAITTADTAHMVNDSFMDRLSFLRNTQCGPCDPCSRGGAWISGLADHLRQDRSQGLRRFTATNGGVALGYDKCFCDDLIVGAGAGYSNNNIHWSKSGGHSDGDLYYYGAYATKYNEDFYLDASVLGFNGQYKSKRHIEFATIDRRAKSKQCAYGVNPHIGAGLICNYCGIDVIPFAEADYYYFHHNKFREHGAHSLNLHVKSYEGSAVRTEAGLRFTKAYDCYCGSFLPYTSISYVGHRYYGRKYKSSFNNQPSNFAVYGTDRCFNQAEFGVGFAYLINDCLAINTSYEIDFGDKRQQQEFNFQLNYRF